MVRISKIICNFALTIKNKTLMNLTISMNTVLNFLHALELSTSQKQWLADKLYEEMNTERKQEYLMQKYG